MSFHRFQKVISELKEGDYVAFETVHRRKDGEEVPVEVRLVHLQIENNTYAIAQFVT